MRLLIKFRDRHAERQGLCPKVIREDLETFAQLKDRRIIMFGQNWGSGDWCSDYTEFKNETLSCNLAELNESATPGGGKPTMQQELIGE